MEIEFEEYQLSAVERESILKVTGLCIWSLDIVVDYKVFGKYIPASRWEPAEYPELDIHDVRVLRYEEDEIDEDLSKLLADQLDYNKLNDRIWEQIDK